jgi:hypothetical protein
MVRIGPSMNIEMRHLRYFVAVAEDASFTAAAQRVHVAQQVLSTSLCVAWRADDLRPAVAGFVKVATNASLDEA